MVNRLLPEWLIVPPAEPSPAPSPLDVFPAELSADGRELPPTASARETHDSFTLLELPPGSVIAPKAIVTPKPPRVRLDVDRASVDVDGVGRTLDDLRQMGGLIYRGYTHLDDICRESEQRSRKVLETLDAIERRVGTLDEVRDLTQAADIRFASIRQIIEEVAQRASEFHVHREAIDRGLVEAARVEGLVSDLERRLATLAEPHVALEQAEARVTSVERRSEQASAGLAAQATDLEMKRQAIEAALAAAARDAAAMAARVEALNPPDEALRRTEAGIALAEQRIEQASTAITTRISELDLKRESIDLALTAATHAVTALDDRVATLAGPEHTLQQAATAFAELERRSAQMLTDVAAGVAGLGTQRDAIESALTHAAQQVHALGERLSVLTAPEQALAMAEGRIEEIEQRTAHVLTEFETQVSGLDARRGTIDAALAAIVGDADALDRRVSSLAAPEHALRQAVLQFDDLEQRSTQALGDLATRATELDAQRQAIELALAGAAQQTQALDHRLTSLTRPDGAVRQAEARIEEVEQRSADAVAAFSTRAGEFAAQCHAIDTALAEAARTTSTLQARVAVLTSPDHALRQAQSHVEDVDRLAAAALADLGNRATEISAQRQAIEGVVAVAGRAQAMLSDVEARLATLTNEAELRRVETTVADMEGRASDAAARLERVVARKDALEPALVGVQRQLQALNEAAQRDLEKLATASKRAARAANGSVPFWRFVAVSALAALVALASIAMRPRGESAPSSTTVEPLLADITRSSPPVIATTEPTRLTTAQNVPPRRPVAERTSAAAPRQPAKAVKEPVRPSRPARVVATSAIRKPVAKPSRPAASTRAAAATGTRAAASTGTRVAAATRKVAPATAAQFVGGLEVHSEPSGAVVYVDTRPVGETPLSLQKIPAGSHAVWVVRDGHARWTRGVLVPANGRTRVSATLDPLP